MDRERSKAEEAFIDQRTRQLLTLWADYCIRNGNKGLPDLESLPSREELDRFIENSRGGIHPALRECKDLEMHREYVDFAIGKGWLGKTVKDGRRQLTSTGWNTAAAFLKR